jgi:hypothetical protein
MQEQENKVVTAARKPVPRWPGILTMAANAGALAAVLLDRCDLATALIVIALIGGVVCFLMSTRSGDTGTVEVHIPPKP